MGEWHHSDRAPRRQELRQRQHRGDREPRSLVLAAGLSGCGGIVADQGAEGGDDGGHVVVADAAVRRPGDVGDELWKRPVSGGERSLRRARRFRSVLVWTISTRESRLAAQASRHDSMIRGAGPMSMQTRRARNVHLSNALQSKLTFRMGKLRRVNGGYARHACELRAGLQQQRLLVWVGLRHVRMGI